MCFLLRGRQFGQTRVRLHEPAERIGARRNRLQSAPRIILPIGRRRLAPQQRFQTSGNRFDRRERIVHFVAEDANESLPGAPLFFAKRAAEVGQDEQFVRQSALAKGAAANAPSPRAARETQASAARLRRIETDLEAQMLARRPSNLSIGWPKKIFARAIDQPQAGDRDRK